MSERVIVWNYGGGVQSVALAVAVRRGLLPHPNHIVMADTGREASTTWSYLDTYVQPMLAEIGLRVQVIPHSLATVDLYSKRGTLLMPVFTAGGGKFSNYCSGEWKTRPVRRYLRSIGVRSARQWIGFSTDEIERIKPNRRGDWLQLHWPLALDLGWSRAMCRAAILDYGLPMPRKSACSECPNRTNAEWREVRASGDWQRVIILDRAIRQSDSRGGVFLHFSRVPLENANLDDEAQPSLWDECGNVCWT